MSREAFIKCKKLRDEIDELEIQITKKKLEFKREAKGLNAEEFLKLV